MTAVFTVEYRERIREQLIEHARRDPRIVAAAAVGSSATGGDRWSDLDLTFGVAGATVAAVLAEWTQQIVTAFGAAVLFDLPVGSTIYRVFLFPGALQVDLSFSPAADFGARTPRFQLIFGEAVERPHATAPSAQHQFGLSVHHALRAHICLERGRHWQALHWLNETRAQAMVLACEQRGLDTSHARGFDMLPPDLLTEFETSHPAGLDPSELRRALGVATSLLLREAGDLATPVLPVLNGVRA